MMQQESTKVLTKIQIKRLKQSKQSWLIRGYLLITLGLILTIWILIFRFFAPDLFLLILSILAIFSGYFSLIKAKDCDEDIKKLKQAVRH
jgi:hypothetical protein